jgi:branched-chain amino acid transport system permease protein
VVGIRTLAFAIAAGLAGLAGGLFASLTLFVNFETFTLSTSIELLLMTILGGSGTLAGPVVGTSVLFLAGQMLQGLQEWQTFAYGALLAAVLFVLPEGVVGTLPRLLRSRSLEHERATATWPRFIPGFESILSTEESPGQDTVVTHAVTLRFGGLVAVNAVDMIVRSATVHAVIGPNGAGKSSLLNLISGFATPSSGRIEVFGETHADWQSHRFARRGIARTFQNTELFGRMSVLENVLAGCEVDYHAGLAETLWRLPRFRREEAAMLARTRLLLGVVGLSDFADEQARNLPFGHQRPRCGGASPIPIRCMIGRGQTG